MNDDCFHRAALVHMREQHIIGMEGRLRHSRNSIYREGKEGAGLRAIKEPPRAGASNLSRVVH